MIHILCNNGLFWETFGFLISKNYDVFYSKFKPSNAFVVDKVEGKWSTIFRSSELWLNKN